MRVSHHELIGTDLKTHVQTLGGGWGTQQILGEEGFLGAREVDTRRRGPHNQLSWAHRGSQRQHESVLGPLHIWCGSLIWSL